MDMKLHTAHLRAQDISTRAFAAYWAEGGYNRDFLVNEARDSLVALLSSTPAGADKHERRAALIDLIGSAISASNDDEATPASQAEMILEGILNNCLPVSSEAHVAEQLAGAAS